MIREFGISESSMDEHKKGAHRAEEFDKTKMFSMILYTTWDIKEYEEGHILSTGFIVVLQELECLQYLSEVVELPLSTLQRLKKLQLGNCYDLERVKINMGLSQGHISNSNFHNLVSVNISRGDEHGDSEIEHQNLCIFSRLVALQLPDIPNLKSIHRWVLPFFFPRITVLGCPNLRKLPLNSNSATNTLK
ncbi:hypothetical protein CK203_047232 [Vitis vinifera]|uniref:Disease resistance protein n=1 Tax=Vitis vinifera TaxID=29760 RepID=A0A438HZ43_VITVI|nr:hypothetical protein CK203_047232 [Vitis vinifera]